MIRRMLVLAAGLAVMACNSTAPGEGLSLSFRAQSATTSVQSDVLVITKAEIVLREVELEAVETADCDVEPEPAGCEEFETGPIRLLLPLDAVMTQVTVDVPPGTYNEAEFEIHKVSSGDAADAAFRAANPDFVDQSIRVEGTFNGQPFVFESDLDVEQEMGLAPPLVVTDQTSTNLTIRVDLSTWFRTTGGALLNPATANKGGPNEELVKQNIKQSFRVFEDRDRDGIED